ncbi:PspC domain-containing protein [Weissella diestrammenae]|uniref:PspC domain-containing protein n=1 Tax=Weissella diestrammenae TaxID=1162633 RepID=A0A7G9T407_9LACO|nr:PspC domain-containing protein [Weissella diestrammenae]MCM0583029.1 PspC domain-containing protein [Weissella diestrammenae]QNN74832.1 PspC domain-containing protein [Weissella diestrammenae]
MQTNKIYRSRNDRVLAGVLGGISEHFGWNSQLVRLLYIAISIFSVAFPGILVYIIALFIIPEAPYRNQD